MVVSCFFRCFPTTPRTSRLYPSSILQSRNSGCPLTFSSSGSNGFHRTNVAYRFVTCFADVRRQFSCVPCCNVTCTRSLGCTSLYPLVVAALISEPACYDSAFFKKLQLLCESFGKGTVSLLGTPALITPINACSQLPSSAVPQRQPSCHGHPCPDIAFSELQVHPNTSKSTLDFLKFWGLNYLCLCRVSLVTHLSKVSTDTCG